MNKITIIIIILVMMGLGIYYMSDVPFNPFDIRF